MSKEIMDLLQILPMFFMVFGALFYVLFIVSKDYKRLENQIQHKQASKEQK